MVDDENVQIRNVIFSCILSNCSIKQIMIFGELQVTIDNHVVLRVYENISSEISCEIWVDLKLMMGIYELTNGLRYLTEDFLPK